MVTDKYTIIITIVLGLLILILLGIFAKRQVTRFSLKSRRGPHYPIGVGAHKSLRKEIECRLDIVKDIIYEPQLIYDNTHQKEICSKMSHIYRMKAVQELSILEKSIISATNDVHKKRPHGQDLRFYLMNLTKEGQPLASCETKLIHQFVDAYISARHEPLPIFDEEQYNKYIDLLNRLCSNLLSKKGQNIMGNLPSIDSAKTTQVNINGKTTLRLLQDSVIPSVDNTETSL